MKAFKPTERDNERGVMRLELSAEDVEILEALVARLEVLEEIEELLNSRAVYSPFITGEDIPQITRQGRELLKQIVIGWGPEWFDENGEWRIPEDAIELPVDPGRWD